MIQVSLKMDEMHALLHAQSMTPNPRMHQAMKRAADRAFARTQSDVHVDTGSLKASGRVALTDDWPTYATTIVYGGQSWGPNDPVTYAIYEMNRGGTHDFMRGATENLEVFTAAMLEQWDA
jgi:hypothetical protein